MPYQLLTKESLSPARSKGLAQRADHFMTSRWTVVGAMTLATSNETGTTAPAVAYVDKWLPGPLRGRFGRNHVKIRSTIGVLAACATVLSGLGCSELSPSPGTLPASETSSTQGTTQDAEPVAHDREINGTGYGYDVPDGWGSPPQEVPGFDPDSMAIDLSDRDGFADNVNVILNPGRTRTPRRLVLSAKKQLAAAGASGISIRDRVRVAGVMSPHLNAVMSTNGKSYTIEQFYPTNRGRTYVVTFSFSNKVDATSRAKVTHKVLTSWVWTD